MKTGVRASWRRPGPPPRVFSASILVRTNPHLQGRKPLSRVALVLNGLSLTMIGVRAMLTPAAFLGQYGIELPSAMALAEARSIHGGGFGALAILMWLGLLRTRLRIPALSAAAFVMLGLALGRLVGSVVDGATDSTTLVATVGEALLGGLAVVALMRENAATSAAN